MPRFDRSAILRRAPITKKGKANFVLSTYTSDTEGLVERQVLCAADTLSIAMTLQVTGFVGAGLEANEITKENCDFFARTFEITFDFDRFRYELTVEEAAVSEGTQA